MKDFLKWVIDNEDWLYKVLALLVSIASYIYAACIHRNSKKRLVELEAKTELESDIASQLAELKSALKERSK